MVTFIGPTMLSGIGQMLHKYLDVFPGSKYHELVPGVPVPPGDTACMFALPIEAWLTQIPQIKRSFKNTYCMTICETETVHPCYGDLFKHFTKIIVASEFCKKVFSRQFPDTEFIVFRAYVPPVPKCPGVFRTRYVFYHIGNIIDQRKNINGIIDAFLRLNRPKESLLVLKATCVQPVKISVPGVLVINGLLDNEDLEKIHRDCDCYVSFSSSEGIGMGAVEAAMHDKPVIITDYGGAPEYIKTPYLVPCGLQAIQADDFLFQKGQLWGRPSPEKLLEYMGHAFENRVLTCDHSFTRDLVSKEEIYKTCPFI